MFWFRQMICSPISKRYETFTILLAVLIREFKNVVFIQSIALYLHKFLRRKFLAENQSANLGRKLLTSIGISIQLSTCNKLTSID